MLELENIEAKMLAYDRPSHKYLSFLRKYFNLYDYYPQNNNFVIFNEYFEKLNADKGMKVGLKTNYSYTPAYNPYTTSSAIIRDKQRRGQGVFSVLGSQMMQRSDTGYGDRNYSAYEKFQGKRILFQTALAFVISGLSERRFSVRI